MKKYLLLSLALFFVGTMGFAQRMSVTDDALDRVVLSVAIDGPAMVSLEMKQELSLTGEQLAQVEKLNQSRFQQLRQAEVNFAGDPSLRSKEFRSIHLQNDKHLSQVLTDQQLRDYQVLEGRFSMQFVSENEEE